MEHQTKNTKKAVDNEYFVDVLNLGTISLTPIPVFCNIAEICYYYKYKKDEKNEKRYFKKVNLH